MPRTMDLRRRTLLRALEILGGESALADELRVPREDLKAWLDGRERAPLGPFLAAVDIVEYCVAVLDYGALEREPLLRAPGR